MWKESLNKSSLKWWKDSVGFWDKRSEGFSKMPRQDWRAKILMDKFSIQPEYKIIDIGAGSGVLAIPLAEQTKHVTAIEPSFNMLTSLKRKAENEKITNITYIQKKWEEIDIDKDIKDQDIVIASYSLAMYDMQEALIKMDKAAKEGVVIFTFAGGIAGSSNYEELWSLLYGEKFYGSPDYVYIYNILHQIGIYANVEVQVGMLKQQYSSLEEAIIRWQDTLNAHTQKEAQVISNYLEKNLARDGDDLFLIQETRNAMIWWRKH